MSKNEHTELEERLAAKAAAEQETEPPAMELDEENAHEIEVEEIDDLEAIDVEALIEEHEALTKERDDLKDQVLRARAEFDNFRKRTARESQELRATAAADLVRDMLPVADNLFRALEHVENPDDTLVKGVTMVAEQFAAALNKAGVQRIAAVGEAFDPTVHDALAQQPSDDVPAGMIILEYEPGYRMGDLVVRPAKVVVSAGSPDGGSDVQEESAEGADQED